MAASSDYANDTIMNWTLHRPRQINSPLISGKYDSPSGRNWLLMKRLVPESWRQPEQARPPVDLLRRIDQNYPIKSFELTTENGR
jgi:hypothetical protein